jgi:TonB family protein
MFPLDVSAKLRANLALCLALALHLSLGVTFDFAPKASAEPHDEAQAIFIEVEPSRLIEDLEAPSPQRIASRKGEDEAAFSATAAWSPSTAPAARPMGKVKPPEIKTQRAAAAAVALEGGERVQDSVAMAETAGAQRADEPGDDDGDGPWGASGHGIGSAAGAGDAVVRNDSAKPRLVSRKSCADLFPFSALGDQGVVSVEVAVSVRGKAQSAEVLSATPAQQGFETAARTCARRLEFSPARDSRGMAAPGRAIIRLRFKRA